MGRIKDIDLEGIVPLKNDLRTDADRAEAQRRLEEIDYPARVRSLAGETNLPQWVCRIALEETVWNFYVAREVLGYIKEPFEPDADANRMAAARERIRAAEARRGEAICAEAQRKGRASAMEAIALEELYELTSGYMELFSDVATCPRCLVRREVPWKTNPFAEPAVEGHPQQAVGLADLNAELDRRDLEEELAFAADTAERRHQIPPCATCGEKQIPLATTGCVIQEDTFVYIESFNATIEEHVRRTINRDFRWEDVRDIEG